MTRDKKMVVVLTLGLVHDRVWWRAGTSGTPLPVGFLGTGKEVFYQSFWTLILLMLVIFVFTVNPEGDRDRKMNNEVQI